MASAILHSIEDTSQDYLAEFLPEKKKILQKYRKTRDFAVQWTSPSTLPQVTCHLKNKRKDTNMQNVTGNQILLPISFQPGPHT